MCRLPLSLKIQSVYLNSTRYSPDWKDNGTSEKYDSACLKQVRRADWRKYAHKTTHSLQERRLPSLRASAVVADLSSFEVLPACAGSHSVPKPSPVPFSSLS